jgi:AraC-like DNA-binding protein
VTVYCAPDFIRSGLMADGIAVPKHIQTFLDPAADSIRFCQLPVTSEIIEVVEDLVGGHGEGRLKLIHMEAKALELFCLILTAFDRLSEAIEEQFSGDDLRRIRKAREILATRFQPVPTIRKLARELGINESKLKRGFKTLYGKTIFEFGHESRMQHAMRLLRDQHMRIGLVAEAVGYTHQTTFASAFKKHFGYRPKEIRRLPVPAPNGRPQRHS